MKLQTSATYGIRIYRRGGYLGEHVDIRDTHIISAIINVAQQVRDAIGSAAAAARAAVLRLRLSPSGCSVRAGCAPLWLQGFGSGL